MPIDDTEISKFLSYVLRHAPESIGLALDSDGWANLDELIRLANSQGKPLNREDVLAVVERSDKKRFSVSTDAHSIRASQGHSSSAVSIKFAEKRPPNVLFHGTATRFLPSIRQHGLLPGARHHVHLSEDVPTAITVGARHGKVVVLKAYAGKMFAEGLRFFQADNGVWLTQNVPVVHLEELDVG